MDLPAGYCVTPRWSLAKNWLLSATLNSPLGVRPKTSLDLSDMFEDCALFRKLKKKIGVQPRAKQPEQSDDVGPDDSASQAGQGGSSSSAGVSSPAKLTPKELKAALAKLARKTAAANPGK